MFTKVLIANRGEIAVRALRTLKRLGIASVTVYAQADRQSPHVTLADEAIALTGDSVADTYLNSDQILAAARDTGVEAIFPGYGFLSENVEFALACEANDLTFIGPTPEQIRTFGLKHRARAVAEAAAVPLLPGSDLLDNLEQASAVAAAIGYPVMLKSTAGGGGIGLRFCDGPDALAEAWRSVRRLGQNFFGNQGVYLERFIAHARHIEVQIFGDGQGQVIALGERDCSLQRRNQKVLEETPAPNLPSHTQEAMKAAAVALGQSVDYRSAGTVEFIYDSEQDQFYFLEVNARLQVEHPVTEAVTGIDLVEWMLQTAAGEGPNLNGFKVQSRGAAIEVRLYAEEPLRQFQPATGTLTEVSWPSDAARVDTWVATGTEISSLYDPLLAKLIVHGSDRQQAMEQLAAALQQTRLSGLATNLAYLRKIVTLPAFTDGRMTTGTLDQFRFQPVVVEVLDAGTYTTVQDYPGRVGYWNVGVPPSGPMDDFAFRIANRIVGNDSGAAGLETTLAGPDLKFHQNTIIALTGAPAEARLDGQPVPSWQPVQVGAGQRLQVGSAQQGCRSYIAVRGGIEVPKYLGSRATFALGQFGGQDGRPLRAGDLLPFGQPDAGTALTPPQAAPTELIPNYPRHWLIGVLYGPHGAPDFFTDHSIEQLFQQNWEVHYHSNRLGIRLNGPKPEFTRADGGEAGLHPSNIHDCAYAIGSINFTGDMPVILTHDGPSLGGFVCPITIARAELWKVGQLKPGDTIRFVAMDQTTAVALAHEQARAIDELRPQRPIPWHQPDRNPTRGSSTTVVDTLPATSQHPQVLYRQAGDQYLLLEYGENQLDLGARLRVHALMEAIQQQSPAGLLELAPGVRSLQVRYDATHLSQEQLVAFLKAQELTLPPTESLSVRSRVLHLPLAFEDSATLDAVARYRHSVRDRAPWLPNNVDFIQRINGLADREQVRRILYEASYLVLGLGDVYLGAPCAVPLDPRHRLMTSKYNPARTYTAEGTVGIGGIYMCIYGMDSPGGYQLVGRTLPIWNRSPHINQLEEQPPWLLRCFDQIRYYPVPEQELAELRERFQAGQLQLKVEEETFSLADYQRFLATNHEDIARFQDTQKAAFAREAILWKDQEATTRANLSSLPPSSSDQELPASGHLVRAELAGNVWRCLVRPGDRVSEGDTLLVVEAMKMEFEIKATHSGQITALHTAVGRPVAQGDPLLSIGA